MVKIGKRKVKFRFLVVILFFTTLIIFLGKSFGEERSAGYIQWGELSSVEKYSGVVVRDEQIVEAENYGKVVYLVPEGERVAKGAKIAELYRLGFDEKALTELITIQQNIKSYQQNNILKDVIDKDLESLDQQIAEKTEKITNIVTGKEDGNLQKLESQLKELMQKRQDYLKKTVRADEYLNRLYDQEKQALEKVGEWKTEITANGTGIVSFYFDGCEVLLDPQNMDKLTIDDVNNILKGSDIKKNEEALVARPLYRLVNNLHWYIILIADKKDQSFAVNDYYDLAVDGFNDKTWKGRVVKINKQDNGSIVILEMEEDIGFLVSVRKVKVSTGKSMEGLKVPLRAITTQGNDQGIVLDDQGKRTFVPVDILVTNGEYAIIQERNDGNQLQVNQRILLN